MTSRARRKTKPTRSRRRKSKPNRSRRRRAILIGVGALLGLVIGGVVLLDTQVRTQFAGKRWALPAHVYARPLELYSGLELDAEVLAAELQALGYRAGDDSRPGGYVRRGGRFDIHTRSFRFWDGIQAAQQFRVRISGGAISELRASRPVVRLDPLLIGSIHPARHEDRELLPLDQIPPLLIFALLAVEDHEFFDHVGVDPRGLARALLANVKAGKAVQGGSTLTQQLVKNFFLSAERTVRRKLVEMVMAVLLELHYTKEEILETYINEIYLGQQGQRAIHGFGLASRFFFRRPLDELELPEIALLVGIIKGPSLYNPRRNPERARARRDVVLGEMARRGFIDDARRDAARKAPLGVSSAAGAASPGFAQSAFMELVRRQLAADYAPEVLNRDGLRIFSSFDPRVQRAAEQAVEKILPQLEKDRRLPAGSLQTAVVVTDTLSGEVRAVVGGRSAAPGGFNRALNARRPVGSLVKPAVYLTALMRPRRYTLATMLDDSPLRWQAPGSAPWTPQNFDNQSHGSVPLINALAYSYNVATARLGLELGVEAVADTLRRLGVRREFPAYPSVLLGALELTPLTVAQVYHTLASGGFRVPLRAVRSVLTAEGQPVQRYGVELEQVVRPEYVYLVTYAMQVAVREGTGRGLTRQLPGATDVAGKTGTTDEFRDSWFAGFAGGLSAVTWVGRDDNRPTGLTGAAGAMRLWGELMRRVGVEPLRLAAPEQVEWAWVDGEGRLSAEGCPGVFRLPFVVGSLPVETAECAPQRRRGKVRRWLDRVFK